MSRVLYLHQYFTTPAEGGGTRSYEFAKRMAEAGFEVHLMTTDRSPGTAFSWSHEKVAGFMVHRIGIPYSNDMGYLQRMIAFLQFAASASIEARRMKADVVFASSTPLTIGIPAVIATLGRKTPMVFEVRDLWPEVPIAMGVLKNNLLIALARWLERFIYHHADRIVALSPTMRDGVIATGYDPKHVSIIPNVCDLPTFAVPASEAKSWLDGHPALAGRPIALYAGSLGKVNDVSWVVELARRVRDADASVAFVIMGKGAEHRKIEALAQSYGLLDTNVFIIQHGSKHDAACAFHACCVSMSTVLPIKALEANSANKFFDTLAAGRPMILNYAGWQLEFLRAHDAGIGLPQDDLDSAAKILLSAIHDAPRIQKMGQNARAAGEDNFAVNKLAAQVVDLLHQVIHQPSAK